MRLSIAQKLFTKLLYLASSDTRKITICTLCVLQSNVSIIRRVLKMCEVVDDTDDIKTVVTSGLVIKPDLRGVRARANVYTHHYHTLMINGGLLWNEILIKFERSLFFFTPSAFWPKWFIEGSLQPVWTPSLLCIVKTSTSISYISNKQYNILLFCSG